MKKYFIRTALCLSLIAPSYSIRPNHISAMVHVPTEIVITPTKEQLKKKVSKIGKHRRVKGEFMGFALTAPVDTSVHTSLKSSLQTYSGPRAEINSLRRHWGTKSQHECGKAVDFKWDEDLIEYLVGEEGQNWLKAHNLMFYIEDKPGSKYLKKYKESELHKEYVFENKNCTGKHIHIQIKK